MEVVTTNPNPDSRLNDPAKSNLKRKSKRASNGAKLAKRMKSMPKYQGSRKKPKDGKKERRLIRKREREYNSDDNEEDEEEEEEEADKGGSDDEEEEEGSEGWNDEDKSGESSGDDDGDEVMQKGITKFTEGCRAFKMAFMKIMKKSQSSDPLGPVLSAHKKLVVNKLAEEVEELKVKGEARKKKHLVGEKGHVQPANFLDSKEKFLISIATKGVVRLFNEAYKLQHAQKGLNPTKSKGAKAHAKLRTDTLSELRKLPTQSNGDLFNFSKSNLKDEESKEPAWAPLKDSYMLTNPKLKDWDKMPVHSSIGDSHKTPLESSSDED